MGKKRVAGIIAIVIVAIFLVIIGIAYSNMLSHKQMCQNWKLQLGQRKIDLNNNYGLLTSGEQWHEFNTQVDNYNAECGSYTDLLR